MMIDEMSGNGSAAYQEYIVLLRRLHATFESDDSESAEADTIRDQMDEPWYRMTPREREASGRLSEQLYAARDRESYRNLG